MPDSFLQLPLSDQAQILNELARRFGRAPTILEKDVWICWVLDQLFSMPDCLKMAFKGGTSLSKVFKIIQRFSEDIDITIDYRNFDIHSDLLNVSKTQIKKMSEELKIHVKNYTHQTVAPYLKNQLAHQFPIKIFKVETTESGEEIRLHYPSALNDINHYITNQVLLEFGGRNVAEPNQLYDIQPDIAQALPNLSFPIAKANVLSAIRTFWEKATLIHAACNQGYWKDSLERKSRHWYDLAMLAKSDIGKQALLEKQILIDVVKYKNTFFYSSYADYQSCLTGKIKLVPKDKSMLEGLKTDFRKMADSGMFYGTLPLLNNVIEYLKILEKTINEGI